MKNRQKRSKQHKLRKNRAVCLLLAGALLWVQPMSTFATSVSQAEKEKREAQQKLEEANKKANEAQQKIDSAESEVVTLSSELSTLIADISLLEADIEYKNGQIREAQGEYDAAKTREEQQYDAMKKRIKYMYERGDTEYLDILLQVKSMTELLNKSEYIEALYTYDRNKLIEFQETKLQVKQYKAQLENEKAEMEGMQIEYAAQQRELEDTIAKKRAEIANFDEQLEIAKQEAAAYTATIARKNEQIRLAEAEARRKAEAARKAVEEQRKRQAEAARLAAAAQSSSIAQESYEAASTIIAINPEESLPDSVQIAQNSVPSVPGSIESSEALAPDNAPNQVALAPGNVNGPAGELAPTTAKQTTAESTTKAPETKAASSGGSGSGQSVANYAMQFIGNPYVYGGTSLTNGADCSGFVQSVYKNFGISLPRSSSGQRSAGTAVDYANAQPGDIICYSGHVGIYIGNGQIVHASSPTTGIKVGNATYRSILSVRRVLN